MSNKVVRPVSLNKNKEADQKILSFIEGKNFSGYVKELILADIEKRNRPLQIVERTSKGGVKIVVGG
jgi:hypothetical protein